MKTKANRLIITSVILVATITTGCKKEVLHIRPVQTSHATTISSITDRFEEDKKREMTIGAAESVYDPFPDDHLGVRLISVDKLRQAIYNQIGIKRLAKEKVDKYVELVQSLVNAHSQVRELTEKMTPNLSDYEKMRIENEITSIKEKINQLRKKEYQAAILAKQAVEEDQIATEKLEEHKKSYNREQEELRGFYDRIIKMTNNDVRQAIQNKSIRRIKEVQRQRSRNRGLPNEG